VFNEGSIIENNLEKIRKSLDQLGTRYEILLCDDHSDDGIESHEKRVSSNSVSYFRFSERIGKGGTIKNVIEQCQGNVIVLLDADAPISSNELSEGISLLSSGCKLVVGARRSRPHTPTNRRVLSIGFNMLMNILFRTGIKDHQCGFKIIEGAAARTLAPMIRSDHFMFDAELIVNAKSQGIAVGVVPVDWLENRADGESGISAPRTMLTMLVDLALLRLRVLGSSRLIRLKKMDAGHFTNLTTGKCLPAHITVIDTNHSRTLGLLRKLYLTVAYSP
jgi:glycosyltransferase involved in cell wall biosynthesis